MANDALVSALARVDLLEGLGAQRLAAIAARAERIVFKAGNVIIEDGAEGDAAYVIVAGEAVRLSSPGESHAVETVPQGSIIGEMAMLIDTEHSSTIAALSPVRALKISRRAMHDLMLADPTLADHLVARIALRLHGVLSNLAAIESIAAGGPHEAADDAQLSVH